MALKSYTVGASAVAGALVFNSLLSKSIGAVAANDRTDTVYPYHGEPWYYFIDHPLPDDTGLDPLRELPWNFDHELRRLYGIANKMTFKPGASWIPTDGMLEAAEDNDEDAIETIHIIEGVCSAVVMAMKKYFGTFEELCSTYRHVCGEALQTTWLEDWVIDEQDVYGRNLVYQRHKYIKSAH
ncbi:hypothetical protein FOZ61_009532 [Perkinsus olseni]|uniref:Uncharacterized protein n=1 Tax=Perkinsus olseni TaxID=32597 RepID=A0A7J6MGF8_PEROL|nr:hypothetical protein FOZ61_009532 [Perkinsus olseni]